MSLMSAQDQMFLPTCLFATGQRYLHNAYGIGRWHPRRFNLFDVPYFACTG